MSLQELEGRIGAALSLAKLAGTPSPTVDGRYVLQRVLGRGASGLVVDAFDDRLHRSVALKLYAQPSERILREGRALARLDHPNVLRVFDVGAGTLVIDGRPTSCTFLSMELIEGESLRTWIEASDRPEKEVRRVLREAGAGLAAAHAAGLVHRDFKPENVMIERSGRVRVVDFGLARPEEREGDPMLSLVGTAPYMAPEQHSGEATTKSDVYSFGRVCVELLTGTLPANPRGMRSVLSTQPSRIRRVLMRALAHEPHRRPDVRVVVEALGPSHRGTWLAVAAAILLLAGGAWGIAQQGLVGRAFSSVPASVCSDAVGRWHTVSTVSRVHDESGAVGAQGYYVFTIEPMTSCRARIHVAKHAERNREGQEWSSYAPLEAVEETDFRVEAGVLRVDFEARLQNSTTRRKPTYVFTLQFLGEHLNGTFRQLHTDTHQNQSTHREGTLEGVREQTEPVQP